MVLIVFLFRASDTRIYTCGTSEWAKRAPGISIHLFIISFILLFFLFAVMPAAVAIRGGVVGGEWNTW